jgi:hypothetical protein
MRIPMVLALITGGLCLAPGPASAGPPVSVVASPVSEGLAEPVASKKVYKQRKVRRLARRNDWTNRRYWRPYQYRYWKYYYPYGGPLF